MATLILIILATLFVSLVSFVGAFLLTLKKKLDILLPILVSFAAGSLIGNAFFHLIPEA